MLSSDGTMASIGSVVREANGVWLTKFATNVGVCSIINVEYWAILNGLSICWKRCWRDVIVETADIFIIQMITRHRRLMLITSGL